MSETASVDVDLDALAPVPKRVRLAGKVWKLPGDLPMELLMQLEQFEARSNKPEADEYALLRDLQDVILGLFQVHQPTLRKLPTMGLFGLLRLIREVYGTDQLGEATPPRPAGGRSQKPRSSSSSRRPARARAT